MPSIDSIEPALDVKEFDDFSVDIVLKDETSLSPPRGARAITVVDPGGGNLQVQTVVGTQPVLTNLTLGERLEPLQVTHIIAAGTDVALIRVYW